ncbi:MAG: response regulator [Syntrophobacteraceae bacterium]
METEQTQILVVDDEQSLCTMVMNFLRRSGYYCDSTKDAHSALAILQEGHHNLVISDIVMPLMNGLELLKRVHEINPQIDTILMTGYTKDHTYSDLIRAGAADFIGKPFTLHELKAKIERIRRERRIQSELRETSAALQLTLNRTHAITESARDAIVMINPDGNISYWNPAAESIFGYSKEEAMGRELHGLIVPQRYLRAFAEGFSGFLQTGRGKAIGKTRELFACRKDGLEIPVELSLSSFYMEGWQSVGLLRDITERKQAEEKLGRINSELQRQTLVAREMAIQAQKASIAKSEFLANMSHEIRTPLNGIIGMTGLLLDSELTEDQKRYAQILRASGEALLGLINNILDFSKIEAKKLDLELVDFDLLSLLGDFTDSAAVAAQGKGLELLCSIPPQIPSKLRGDPGRLGQVITNLLGNAIKFTHAGEVALLVSLESETESTAILRFVVRDTGIGIPREKLPLLFEKFTQVDASTTREYGGTGLGLSITKQLVELMDGQLGVKSEYGRGTQFWFTMPLQKQPDGSQPKTVAFENLKGVRALIVDDNATSRQILSSYMTFLGMRPEAAMDETCAREALLRAAQEGDPFRLAVLDRQMPGMEAKTLALAINSDSRLADTRMVMLITPGTGNSARSQLDSAPGANLSKPVRYHELGRTLSLALTDPGAASEQLLPPINPWALRGMFVDKKLRVLIAEDNLTNQEVALGILKKFAINADAVANGAEAVKALESIPYDIVLMDVQMPVLDGLEATRKIRAMQSAMRNVPIIALTAHAIHGDREKCLSAGMNDYITKPVTPQALAGALQKWAPNDGGKNYPARSVLRSGVDTGNGRQEKPSVWNKAEMLDRLMGDADLAKKILEGFIDDIPKQIEILSILIEHKDFERAERQAHSIKGACSIVGAETMQAAAWEIEKAANAQDLAPARAIMTDLQTHLKDFKKEIDARQTQGKV